MNTVIEGTVTRRELSADPSFPARIGVAVLLLFVAALAAWGALRLLLPLTPGVLGWAEAGRLLLASAAFLATYLLFASPFARGIGFRALATELNLPFFARRDRSGGEGG